MPWVNYKAEALSVNSKANYSREKSSDVYVVSIVSPGLPDHANLTKSRNWIFTHVRLSACAQ